MKDWLIELLGAMTVRVSWLLTLATFIAMIVALSVIGLYAAAQSQSLMTALVEASQSQGSPAVDAVVEESAALVATVRWLIVGIVVVTALTTAVVLWGITVNVIRPLERVVGYFARMARGDLSQVIEQRGSNEIGKLYASLASMQSSLAGTVGTVRNSSETIHSDSRRLAQSNGELSERTYDQSASLVETSASMEELSATVEQNADNARQASEMAAAVARLAEEGGVRVSDVVAVMQEIDQSASTMASCIEVIDTIAFQTNLLALNASVEAARAGEQGRSFAVVAGEVRNLANRAAAASKDIGAQIEATVNRVAIGNERVGQAGATMQEIVQGVGKVSELMEDIARASREQSQGIAQVNDAVAQMDSVTQRNADMARDAVKSSTELEQLAATLRASVERFQLAGRRGVAPARADGEHGGAASSRRALQQSTSAQESGESGSKTASRCPA